VCGNIDVKQEFLKRLLQLFPMNQNKQCCRHAFFIFANMFARFCMPEFDDYCLKKIYIVSISFVQQKRRKLEDTFS
jgi:hypothetical protein